LEEGPLSPALTLASSNVTVADDAVAISTLIIRTLRIQCSRWFARYLIRDNPILPVLQPPKRHRHSFDNTSTPNTRSNSDDRKRNATWDKQQSLYWHLARSRDSLPSLKYKVGIRNLLLHGGHIGPVHTNFNYEHCLVNTFNYLVKLWDNHNNE
jgi:hypothetical protein